ncbi:MAG: response regulator transcription factor [Elusimicrobia bacterium]|nr:response regulator transcription factor [Elusimicrobiota bacterium]
MRLLLIEDDEKIASFVAKGFSQSGYAVDVARDGDAGLKLALERPYGAAVIDLMLPKLDGLSVIEALRRRGVALPVIILSAKRSVDERVRGLQSGGDDYLAKPFAFSELLARVQALIRRSGGTADPTRLSSGMLTMNLLTREVRRGTQKVALQAREFALLECLMRQAGHPVSKTMILENVWGYDFDPQTNVVDVLVHRLRDKLDKPFGTATIKTLRGVGYVLDAA